MLLLYRIQEKRPERPGLRGTPLVRKKE
jgi:hypothetical protein